MKSIPIKIKGKGGRITKKEAMETIVKSTARNLKEIDEDLKKVKNSADLLAIAMKIEIARDRVKEQANAYSVLCELTKQMKKRKIQPIG